MADRDNPANWGASPLGGPSSKAFDLPPTLLERVLNTRALSATPDRPIGHIEQALICAASEPGPRYRRTGGEAVS